jgi:sugar lactone lactonase YvrE
MTLNLPPQLRHIGSGLRRPECVLAHASGVLFAADWEGKGGIAAVTEDGEVKRLTIRSDIEIRPNGIALEAGGSFLIAHLGTDTGGLYRLHPDGALDPVLTELDGRPLPPSNFPIVDASGRIWLTISTTKVPRADDYRPEAASGFVVLIDQRGARVVADGLGYTNEIAFSADGTFAYVNETFARRVRRFRVQADGALTDATTFGTLEAGDYPDGIVFDADGGLWVTSIVSNRVIRIAPDGTRSVFAEESDPSHIAWVEEAYQTRGMGRPHLDAVPTQTFRNISSLAFGGPDLRTAYLGCLLGDSIIAFDAPVAGLRPLHYDVDIAPLLKTLDLQ